MQTPEGEFFIPPSALNGAFGGDLVEIIPTSRHGATKGDSGRSARDGKGSANRDFHGSGESRNSRSIGGISAAQSSKPSARVRRVLDHAYDALIGRYEVAEPFGVVVPLDKRIPYDVFTMRADHPHIRDGAIVRVRLVEYPTGKSAATGVVEEVIGNEGKNVSTELIIARHKLKTEFPLNAMAEAKSARLHEEEALASGYRDLRDRFIFTIDPRDAKDFDDAVSLEPMDDDPTCRWRLGVHIADVSHYVPWNSSLDLEARMRASSVYLVDRVLPMLPPELSDDLCSLLPHTTRRSMTVDLYLNDDAEVVRTEFYPALVESKARLSYEQALDLLQSSTMSDGLTTRLRGLSHIARLRAVCRRRAGGLDFDTAEAKVKLDSEGKPLEILLRRKTEATQLIEEAMIMANEAVAEHLYERGIPSLYRVHEPPAADALAALIPVLQEFPWFTKEMAEEVPTGNPWMLRRVMDAASGRSEETLITTLVLRSMKRAVYKPHNEGHYGLASTAYTHFTSPIRRYPDLVVHRRLRACLEQGSDYQSLTTKQALDEETQALSWIGEYASEAERVSESAERESVEAKIIEYLEGFIGTSYSAVISGVAAYGVYARLENTAEGFIPVKSLGRESFAYNPERQVLRGLETDRRFRLGQRVAVKLVHADARAMRLEFALKT